MNTMRTISRVLVIATVAFIGDANAVSGKNSVTKVYNAADSVKARVIFAHIGDSQLAKDNHVGKAGVAALGYVIDMNLNGKDMNLNGKIDICDKQHIVKYFMVDYATRVASDKLGKAGINPEFAAKTVANLSGGLVDKSKAQTAIEYVTHPEVLVFVGGILYGMLPSINASEE